MTLRRRRRWAPQRSEAEREIIRLLDEVGWRPALRRVFTGNVKVTEKKPDRG